MITSEELMIGNYLFDGAGRLCQVDKLQGWGFSAPAIKGSTTTVSPAHSGIPLTPEILTEWCGFQKITENLFFGNGFTLNKDSNGIYYDRFGNGMNILIFDYLHEFQNWYYWNSGKQQLTISAHRINKASKD